MKSVNEILRDEAIHHATDLQKYSAGVVQRMLAVINKADARLFAELTAALADMTATKFSVERLQSLMYSVERVNSAAFGAMGLDLVNELRSFVDYETAYQAQVLVSVLPVQVHVATISAEQVYTAALSRPFQGVLLKGVLADMEQGKAKKIRQAIALGYTENKTTDQIIREIRGTRANGYADGLMQAGRREIATVVHTALGHMAGFTQDRVVEANLDIIKAVQWSSTLDQKTTVEFCVPRDGKLYTPDTHRPIGHQFEWASGPGVIHWNCRSHQTNVLKSNKELGIDGPEIVIEGRTRSSMDGQVPADVAYPEWLAKQSAGRQNEVLGPTRAQWLRDGKLSVADMYGPKGQHLTIAELKARNARL